MYILENVHSPTQWQKGTKTTPTLHADMQKAASMASMLVLFFSQTVQIFVLKTRSACTTANFWNVL